MINSLNPAMLTNSVNFQNNVPGAPVSVQNNNQPQPVTNPNLNGLQAMAGYNQPVKTMKKEIQPALPTVLQPEAVHALKGERVTNALGRLDSIIDRNDKTITVYKMDPQAPNDVVSKIVSYDAATGKLIRTQENYNEIKPGQMPVSDNITIKEFDSEGNVTKFTDYYDNKYSVQQHEKMPDGSKKIYAVCSDKSSYIAEEDANGQRTKTTQFTPSGQIAEVVNFDGNDNPTQIVTYKNGVPAKIENPKQDNFNPELAKIPSEDKDITPAQPHVLGYDPKTVQGEKTYFSNGMVQDITTKTANGTIVHSFDALGSLDAISIDEGGNKKHILFNNYGGDKMYSITEEISKDVEKTTTFEKDGSINVAINDFANKEDRHAQYAKTGQLTWYSKSNEQTKEHLALGFDLNGNLKSVF